jgi:ABC-2 type transport system permease protein
MSAILALALKDLRILFRVKSAMFFAFAWPLIVAILFGTVFAGPGEERPRGIGVAMADDDLSPGSRDFAASIAGDSRFNVRACPREEALALVRQRRRAAALILTKGFGEASQKPCSGNPPKVEVWMDPSRAAEAGMIQGLLYERMMGQVEKKVPMLSGGRWQPLAIEQHDVAIKREGPRNGYEITFPQGLVWGVLGCAMGFAIGFISERTHGTLTRLRIAAISRVDLLAGKALACGAACIMVQAMVMVVGIAVFRVRPSSWPLLVMAAIATTVAFVGMMMLLAGLCKTEESAGIGWAVFMPLSLFGGGMVPLAFMPPWMAQVGVVSPVRWSILAIEGSLWRGFSLGEMLLPCGVLVLMGAACFFVGTRTLRLS